MEALNSEVFVVVAPVATFSGSAPAVGRRCQLVDVRGNDIHGRVYHYQDTRGRTFSCSHRERMRCLSLLSGPRQQR